jgi:hypothetical protein
MFGCRVFSYFLALGAFEIAIIVDSHSDTESHEQ